MNSLQTQKYLVFLFYFIAVAGYSFLGIQAKNESICFSFS